MHLFRRLLLPLLSLCLAFQSHAEEQRFISDALSTYVHSGPGNQYRIVGTINAGDPVTLLGINQQSQFAQIRDAKGRSVWLPLDQLSNQPSLRTRVPALEAQLSALTAKLSHIDGEWQQKTAEMQSKVAGSDDAIARLQAENQQLRQQLSSAQKASAPSTRSWMTKSGPLSCSGSCTAAASPALACCWACCSRACCPGAKKRAG